MTDQAALSFTELVKRPDGEIDLALGALLIARELEYPDLDTAPYLALLEEYGAEARSRTRHAKSALEAVQSLSGLIFGELGFRGNEEAYYDPRNSFLNDVIDRRVGIPITLATVYVEIGRRAGLQLDGVNFPWRFLAKYVHPAGFELVVDPFGGGRVLGEDDCQRLLDQFSNGTAAFHPLLLRPAPTKQILSRMLNNLKQIYVEASYYRKAIAAIDLLLAITPRAATELRDRGLLRFQLREFEPARQDLAAYLESHTAQDDAPAIRRTLAQIDQIGRAMK